MATKDDIAQLKKSIQELRRGQLEILLKLDVCSVILQTLMFLVGNTVLGSCPGFINTQDLQEKLEGGEGKKPAEPEPILTCVHCSAEYEESKNAGLSMQKL